MPPTATRLHARRCVRQRGCQPEALPCHFSLALRALSVNPSSGSGHGKIREIGKIKDREWPKMCRFPAEAVDKFQWPRRESTSIAASRMASITLRYALDTGVN